MKLVVARPRILRLREDRHGGSSLPAGVAGIRGGVDLDQILRLHSDSVGVRSEDPLGRLSARFLHGRGADADLFRPGLFALVPVKKTDAVSRSGADSLRSARGIFPFLLPCALFISSEERGALVQAEIFLFFLCRGFEQRLAHDRLFIFLFLLQALCLSYAAPLFLIAALFFLQLFALFALSFFLESDGFSSSCRGLSGCLPARPALFHKGRIASADSLFLRFSVPFHGRELREYHKEDQNQQKQDKDRSDVPQKPVHEIGRRAADQTAALSRRRAALEDRGRVVTLCLARISAYEFTECTCAYQEHDKSRRPRGQRSLSHIRDNKDHRDKYEDRDYVGNCAEQSEHHGRDRFSDCSPVSELRDHHKDQDAEKDKEADIAPHFHRPLLFQGQSLRLRFCHSL